MIESQEVSGRKRRSREEIQRLMMEFESSGLRQNEFCRKHGLALSTLQRQLKKRRLDQGEAKSSRLIAEQICGSPTAFSPKCHVGARDRLGDLRATMDGW